jgi:GNAT superfamily N-acetyltransferase
VRRNVETYSGFRFDPVEDFSIFAGFSCLDPSDADRDLDRFLQDDAQRHYLDRIAVTYVLTKEDSPGEALGFFTLQNDAVIIDRANPLPEVATYPYSAFPAVKIGRFGISLDMQKHGLGTVCLGMIKSFLRTANRTGCRFITVDARRDKKNKVDTRPFYAKNGFAELVCRPKTSLYIPMYFDLIE